MAQRETERRPAVLRLIALSAAALLLGGCSWVPNALNPVEWYRDATGASEHDDTGSERNAQNLEAGGKQPYPNLGSVPKPPDTALSAAERERLQKGLVADRANARYSDEELRQGRTVPPLPGERPAVTATPGVASAATADAPTGGTAGNGEGGPAAPSGTPRQAPPARGSAAAPQESPLVAPQVRSTPEGEAAHAPPPAPAGVPQRSPAAQPGTSRQLALVAPPPPPAAAPSQPAVMRAPTTGRRANVVLQATEITFSGASTSLGEQDNRNLAEVAKLSQNADAHLRIIGYMHSTAGDAAERELRAFNTALDRANAVAQALIKHGIAANHIIVQAAPELASTGSDTARVEVFLEY
jgi:outer membrane protein OmpA-like peptidoglycan-associated protein